MPLSTSTTHPATALGVARVRVVVDGSELGDMDHDVPISSVEAVHEVGRPGSFVIEAADLTPESFDWLDTSAIQEGAPVEIYMGYDELGALVFSGEILGVELEIAADSGPKVSIRGYDRLHRLARARKTRAFVTKRDSEIAADLAREHGMSVDGPKSRVIHPYVLQAGQTDLAFLRARARAIGYVVRADAKVLKFAPRELSASAAASAVVGENLLEFHGRTSVLGQVGGAAAYGWDPNTQKALLGEAASAKLQSLMGGDASGLEIADEAFKAQVTDVPGVPFIIADDAALAAAAELEALALEHVTCDGSIFGEAALRPGDILEIAGVGVRFSGNYWLTRVTHTWGIDGFTTKFEGRRTAS